MNPFDNIYATLALVGAAYLVVRLVVAVRRSQESDYNHWNGCSTTELENVVFTIHDSYFAELGEPNAAIAEFRSLVAKRDLDALVKRWPALQRAFLSLERIAGHRGRPALYDYYFRYLAAVRVLRDRRAQA